MHLFGRSLLIGCSLLFASGAVAQLRQPRCGGWPPSSTVPGLIIGINGSPCYGTLVPATSFSLYEALIGAEVRRAPKTFRMIGANEFTYMPSPGQQRPDDIEVALTWSRAGRTEVRTSRMKGYSEELYQRAGGSSGTPPPGETVGRPLGPMDRLPR